MSKQSRHIPARRILRFAFMAVVLAGGATAAQAAWVPAKAALAQLLLDRAFAASQDSGETVRPWPWADTTPVARVSVPRLAESAVVLSGASAQALAFGPTQVPTRPGVTLLAAHRDTHFAFMQDLELGDRIVSEGIDGSRAEYRVTTLYTVRWDEFAIARNLPGEWLVLATCYPFHSEERGPLRRVAWAELVG